MRQDKKKRQKKKEGKKEKCSKFECRVGDSLSKKCETFFFYHIFSQIWEDRVLVGSRRKLMISLFYS